ncbi:MAG: AraC family transcriptional regulator [Paenibacillus sp.]|nr:AraC family transcriptional regulator [Paenibacillus sp.]
MLEIANQYIESLLFVPDPLSKELGIWLLAIGRNIAKPEYDVKQRRHQRYTIHFVMQGQVELSYDQMSVVLGKGDSFCMFPGYSYAYKHVVGETPLKMVWITFNGPVSSTLVSKAGYTEAIPYLRQVMTKQLHEAMQQLFVPATNGFKRQLELQAALFRIFGCLTPSEESAVPANGPDYWIPKSIEYMKTHYMERINVQNVADYIGIHRVYLSKVFTKKVGMTPMRFLEQLKMEKAMELLRTTVYTVSEVALAIGYPDPYTFTHAFSRYYDSPPGKWRSISSDAEPQPSGAALE